MKTIFRFNHFVVKQHFVGNNFMYYLFYDGHEICAYFELPILLRDLSKALWYLNSNLLGNHFIDIFEFFLYRYQSHAADLILVDLPF